MSLQHLKEYGGRHHSISSSPPHGFVFAECRRACSAIVRTRVLVQHSIKSGHAAKGTSSKDVSMYEGRRRARSVLGAILLIEYDFDSPKIHTLVSHCGTHWSDKLDLSDAMTAQPMCQIRE